MTPRVTDHAIVRYLERVMGIDIADVRARVIALAESGAIARRGGRDFRAVVEGDAVVTVCPVEPLPPRAKPRRARKRHPRDGRCRREGKRPAPPVGEP